MYGLMLCLIIGSDLSPRTLEKQVLAMTEEAQFRDAFWGVAVYAPLRGQWLIEKNADRNFHPASNMKVLTTLMALHYLGPDYCFQTQVCFTGDFRDGHLDGDLVLRGGGDPSFSGRHTGAYSTEQLMEALVAQIRSAGLQSVKGDLVVDPFFFDEETIHFSWEWSDMGYYYAVPVTALSLNNARYDITLQTDETGDLNWQVWPQTADFQFHQEKGHNKPLALHRPWGDDTFTLRGETRACMLSNWSRATWQPDRQFSQVLKVALANAGIQIEGELRVANQQVKDTRLLVAWASDPLALPAQILMKQSQNHYADAFLKTTAKEVLGDGSFEAGARLADQFLKEIGARHLQGHQVRDGSGLSAQNYLQPRQLVDLLRYGLTASYRDDWLATLPAKGVDGTLRRRGSAITRARVWAKTGYINRTRTLSGYVETLAGEPLVFSLMANNYSSETRRVNEAQDQICALLRRLKLKRKLRNHPRLFELSNSLDQFVPDSYPLDR